MILQEADKFYIELGGLIKGERIKRKITQDDLSLQLGLTRASVINLEKGRHRPSIYQILLIAKYFKMDYTKLIPLAFENSTNNKEQSIPLKFNTIVSDQGIIDSSVEETIQEFLTSVRNS